MILGETIYQCSLYGKGVVVSRIGTGHGINSMRELQTNNLQTKYEFDFVWVLINLPVSKLCIQETMKT